MTTRILTTILAALLALAIVAPVAADIPDTNWSQAANPEYEISGYVNRTTGDVWIAGRLPMAGPYEARNLVALTDAADIERNLDMTVLASDINHDLASLGIGAVNMYAGLMDGGDAMVLLTSHGADVWLFVFSMPDMGDFDAEAAALWSVTTMLGGASTPGAGFVAIDADQAPAWEGKLS